MRNGPITIPEVAGPVTVDSHFWSGRQRVMVGDQRAAVTWRSGKRTFALPTADGGAAEARVSRSIMINPFPTVEVGGVKYPTGPEIPVAVRILMVAPILLAAPFGGLVGVLVAFGATGINYNLVRSARRPATRPSSSLRRSRDGQPWLRSSLADSWPVSRNFQTRSAHPGSRSAAATDRDLLSVGAWLSLALSLIHI